MAGRFPQSTRRTVRVRDIHGVHRSHHVDSHKWRICEKKLSKAYAHRHDTRARCRSRFTRGQCPTNTREKSAQSHSHTIASRIRPRVSTCVCYPSLPPRDHPLSARVLVLVDVYARLHVHTHAHIHTYIHTYQAHAKIRRCGYTETDAVGGR